MSDKTVTTCDFCNIKHNIERLNKANKFLKHEDDVKEIVKFITGFNNINCGCKLRYCNGQVKHDENCVVNKAREIKKEMDW